MAEAEKSENSAMRDERSIIVHQSHYRDPFKSLFLEFLESFDTFDLNSKSLSIQSFVKELEELENTSENQSIALYWSSIFSVFSATSVISAFSILNPLAGVLLGSTAAATTLGIILIAFIQNRERTPILQRLKKYRLAFESDSFLNWACLWQYIGTEEFFNCMYAATSGYILNGNLIRNDGKNPMAAALDAYCKVHGMSRDELISHLSFLKKSLPSSTNLNLSYECKTNSKKYL